MGDFYDIQITAKIRFNMRDIGLSRRSACIRHHPHIERILNEQEYRYACRPRFGRRRKIPRYTK